MDNRDVQKTFTAALGQTLTMENHVKRWTPINTGLSAGVVEDPRGAYVSYADHAARAEELERERDAARQQARMSSFMGEGYALMESRAIAAEARALLARLAAEREAQP